MKKNVRTESIIENIGLGDYAECLNDYRNSDCYLSDAISQIADNNTSIYYSDIINFIAENVEEVNEAIQEFGWDGCGKDLYKAGQMAEYLQIMRDIYDHLEDAILLMACDYIRYDLKCNVIPEELADNIYKWAHEINSDSRCNEILERINGWVGTEYQKEEA